MEIKITLTRSECETIDYDNIDKCIKKINEIPGVKCKKEYTVNYSNQYTIKTDLEFIKKCKHHVNNLSLSDKCKVPGIAKFIKKFMSNIK